MLILIRHELHCTPPTVPWEAHRLFIQVEKKRGGGSRCFRQLLVLSAAVPKKNHVLVPLLYLCDTTDVMNQAYLLILS